MVDVEKVRRAKRLVWKALLRTRPQNRRCGRRNLHVDTHRDRDDRPVSFTPWFGGAKTVLAGTPKAVTPCGGLCRFIAVLRPSGRGAQGAPALPFVAPTTPAAIPPAPACTAFFFAVVTGASRFAHPDRLRGDCAVHALLGSARFPGNDTVRAFFRRFTLGHVEAFWRPRWTWSRTLIATPPAGFDLALDSTVICREGQQEGARRGYNPRRKGRNRHHPLLAVLAEPPFFLHGWLRSGHCSSARGAVELPNEALALTPATLEGRGERTAGSSPTTSSHFRSRARCPTSSSPA